MRRLLIVSLLGALGLIAPPGAQAASSHACPAILNPYAGTRYEGVNLNHIRARHVTCRSARRVTRGAHHKALGLGPPASGVRHFSWKGWKVSGDLRPSRDRYVARKGSRRVTWRF